MKKLYFLLLAMFTCFTLSAQIVISGGCLGGTTLNFTESGNTVNGKPEYIDAANSAIIQWLSNSWVVFVGGNPIIFNTDDIAVPPSSVAGTWSDVGGDGIDCAGANTPTVVDVALPVSWAYFYGERSGKTSVQLEWGTFEEIGSEGYYVERSADGLIWEQLKFVSSTESRSATNEYGYLDRRPMTGNNFYRLQQLDFTGGTSFSEVVEVAFILDSDEMLISPNPANNEIAIYGPTESGAVTIMSQQGKVVRRLSNYTPGTSILVGDLPASLYVLRFENVSSQVSKKIVIR